MKELTEKEKIEEFAKSLAEKVSKTKSGYSVNPLDDIDWDEDDEDYFIPCENTNW